MKFQLLSDLHMETEAFTPELAVGAELLVLAGDVDSRWDGLAAFANWPVPVILVPGNHEYDQRDVDEARAGLRLRAEALGFILLDDASCVLRDAQGRRIRFVGSTRWSDFDVFGEAQRERAMRAAAYFQRVMGSRRRGAVFDAAAVREWGLQNRAYLAAELAKGRATPDWDETVVITHFAPSLRSSDPRYGRQPGTASFCNNDEDLMPGAGLWVHGHLHCQHDYRIEHSAGSTRVLCNARGHGRKGEHQGCQPLRLIEV